MSESEKILFAEKYVKFADEYELFLMWCLDNNGKMTMDEWNLKKSIEFKKRGLDKIFQ